MENKPLSGPAPRETRSAGDAKHPAPPETRPTGDVKRPAPRETGLTGDAKRIERPTFTEPAPGDWPKPRAILDLDYVSRKRLAALMPVYDVELQHLSHRAALKGDAEAAGFVAAALTQLEKTKDALKEGDADLGWQCLHSAQRMTLHALEHLDPDYFQVVARSVYHEAKAKLGSWRKETVLDSLGGDDKDRTFDESVSSSEVAAATLILHEHHGNVYQKIQDSLQQLRTLTIILLAAAALFVGVWPFVEWNGLAEAEAIPALSFSALMAVALFGIMGACVSGIRQLAVGATKGKIPDRLIAAWVTLTRPIVGAVAAMTIYFFLTGGLFPIIDIEAGRLEAYLAVAFAAGFSEQLVWRAAETLSTTRS